MPQDRLPVVDTEPEESARGPLDEDGLLDEGPVRPDAEVRDELATLLKEDQSRLGEVYRALQQGLDAGAIAAELEIGTSSFVWNYGRIIKAVLDGNLPTAPTVALGAARRFRSILKSASLSQEHAPTSKSTFASWSAGPTTRPHAGSRSNRRSSRPRPPRHATTSASTSMRCRTICGTHSSRTPAGPC